MSSPSSSSTPSKVAPLSLGASPATKSSSPSRWARDRKDKGASSSSPSGSPLHPSSGSSKDSATTLVSETPRTHRGSSNMPTSPIAHLLSNKYLKPELTPLSLEAISALSFDFEKLYGAISNPVFQFPDGLARVAVVPRKHREHNFLSLLPSREERATLPYYIQICLQTFESEWCVLIRTDPSVRVRPASELIRPLERLAFDHSDSSDPSRMPALSLAAQTDSELATARGQGRQHLFETSARTVDDGEEYKAPQLLKIISSDTNLFQQKPLISVLIEPKALTWDLGDFEPMWCTIAAYDINLRRRVSENFSFAPNSYFSNKLVDISAKSEAEHTKKAIFSFTRASPDIFLILRVEKVLQGELDEISKPYLEGHDFKAKYRDKLKGSISDVCSRLRPYRQQLGWSMMPLFDSEEAVVTAQELSFSPIFRQKSELSDEALLESVSASAMVSKSKGGTASRKGKVLRGSLTFQVSPLPEFPNLAKLGPCRLLSPCLLPINPAFTPEPSSPRPSTSSSSSSSSSPVPSTGPIIRELQEFAPKPQSAPLMDYINNMYVYPSQLSMSKPDNYQLRVHLLSSDRAGILDPKTIDAMPSIYDPLSPDFRKSVSTSVVYKAKVAAFSEEIKVQLPALLTPQHHLIFVIYRVNVKPPKKNEPSSAEVPCGFCFLPLFKDNCVNGLDHELLAFADLPASYLTLPLFDKTTPNGLRPIEGGKPVLRVRTVLSSSIYSQDRSLVRALSLFCQGDSGPGDLLKNTQAIHALREAPPAALMCYLPLLIEHHLRMISADVLQGDKSHQGLTDLSVSSLTALCRIFQSLQEFDPSLNHILQSYVQYVLDPARFPALHLTLTERWLQALVAANGQDDNLIAFSHFFFGAIFKNLLAYAQTLKSARSISVLPAAFYSNLTNLVSQMIWEAQSRSVTGVVVGKDLMYALVFFVQDLFSVLNRGFVIQLISLFTSNICPNDSDLTLIDFQFAFLRHVSSYRYWVHLNIPSSSLDFSLDDLLANFGSRHFLSGLLLTQLSHYSSHKEQVIRLQAYSLLRAHLYDLHFDLRFQDLQHRSLIARLYFPYIMTIIDRIHVYQAASHAEKRHLFICFVYLLRAVPIPLFGYWWGIESVHRLCRFFETIRVCLEVFEYIGQARLTELMGVDQGAQASDSTKAQLEEFYTTGPPTRKAGGRNFRAIRNEQRGGTPKKGNKKPGFLFDELKEMNLSAESSCTVLDIVCEFVRHSRDRILSESAPYELFSKIFQVYLSFLRLRQCDEVLLHFYPALRSFVQSFSAILFSSAQPSFAAELTTFLVVHANSPSPLDRTQALSTLYHCMHVNFCTVADGKFTRMKIQFAHSVSRLEGVSTVFLLSGLQHMDQSFIRSTASAGGASPADPSFLAQLSAVLQQARSVLQDMAQMVVVENDLEAKHDLLLQIAASFPEVPDLRVHWLEKLALDHAKHEQWAEAAAVMLHLITLAVQFLCLKQKHAVSSKLPELARYVDYQNWPTEVSYISGLLSPNLLEETLEPHLVLRNTDSVCESRRFFGVDGFVNTCIEAIGYLHKATLWESIYGVNKLLVPIYEYRREFTKLTDLFDDLYQSYAKANSDLEARTRTLGLYYRVVLHGGIFGAEAGAQYIYKTPLLTRLGQIKARLEEVYSAKYGEGRISVWPKSEPPESVPADQGYIQIIAVDPYFDSTELSTTKVTYFEQNHNINRFYNTAPFTRAGQKHSDSLADQWVRQFILTTEKYFPYVKNRLRVVAFDSVEISPIEASIETIESQTRKLHAEIRSPNAKSLQMVLQGSLLVQVQAGPKAIASIFFDPQNVSQFEAKHVDRLRTAFQSFLKVCREAISFNRLIAPDQILLQEELENSYAAFEVLLVELGVVQSVVRRFQAVQQA